MSVTCRSKKKAKIGLNGLLVLPLCSHPLVSLVSIGFLCLTLVLSCLASVCFSRSLFAYLVSLPFSVSRASYFTLIVTRPSPSPSRLPLLVVATSLRAVCSVSLSVCLIFCVFPVLVCNL